MEKKEMMRWDQSSLLADTIPDAGSNLLSYGTEEAGWARSNMSQNPATCQTFFEVFFPFLLTSLEICTLSPILQMANLRFRGM